MALVVKNLPANAGDIRGMSLIPGLGRCPGEGHDNPLQYSCLKNFMDRPWGRQESDTEQPNKQIRIHFQKFKRVILYINVGLCIIK